MEASLLDPKWKGTLLKNGFVIPDLRPSITDLFGKAKRRTDMIPARQTFMYAGPKREPTDNEGGNGGDDTKDWGLPKKNLSAREQKAKKCVPFE